MDFRKNPGIEPSKRGTSDDTENNGPYAMSLIYAFYVVIQKALAPQIDKF